MAFLTSEQARGLGISLKAKNRLIKPDRDTCLGMQSRRFSSPSVRTRGFSRPSMKPPAPAASQGPHFCRALQERRSPPKSEG